MDRIGEDLVGDGVGMAVEGVEHEVRLDHAPKLVLASTKWSSASRNRSKAVQGLVPKPTVDAILDQKASGMATGNMMPTCPYVAIKRGKLP